MFARQNLFNAKRWYRTMYKDIESQMTEDALFQAMTQAYSMSFTETNGTFTLK